MLFHNRQPSTPASNFLPRGPAGFRLRGSGDDGARTRDLVVANHALSKLSYIPFGCRSTVSVGVLGFEPRTSALSELRSSQLSYTPVVVAASVKSKKPNRVGF